jgi:hypothetical protein
MQRINRVTETGVFETIKAGPGSKREFQFVRVPNLKNHHIMFCMIKMSEPFENRRDIPKAV